MIQIAYVEDDVQTAGDIAAYLERYQGERQTAMYVVHYAAAEPLLAHAADYDLVLLDIRLPGISGMEAARRLRAANRQVVLLFLTSLAQYAVQGYEVEALDFLVKPVNYYALAMKLDRAVQAVRQRQGARLTVSTERGLQVLDARQIFYVEVSNHSLVYHTDAGPVQTRSSLRAVEDLLEANGFVRIGSSCLVNLRCIAQIDGFALRLFNGETVFISRARKKAVLAALAAYLGGGGA